MRIVATYMHLPAKITHQFATDMKTSATDMHQLATNKKTGASYMHKIASQHPIKIGQLKLQNE